MPKNNVPIGMRRNILNTSISINNFSDTNLSFNSGNKLYNINIENYKKPIDSINKISNIVYTESRESVIISSD